MTLICEPAALGHAGVPPRKMWGWRRRSDDRARCCAADDAAKHAARQSGHSGGVDLANPDATPRARAVRVIDAFMWWIEGVGVIPVGCASSDEHDGCNDQSAHAPEGVIVNPAAQVKQNMHERLESAPMV